MITAGLLLALVVREGAPVDVSRVNFIWVEITGTTSLGV